MGFFLFSNPRPYENSLINFTAVKPVRTPCKLFTVWMIQKFEHMMGPPDLTTFFQMISYCEIFLIIYSCKGRHFPEKQRTFHLMNLSCLVASIRECDFQGLESAINIIAVWVHHADTHVPDADILGSDLLVQAASKDHTLLKKAR